MSTIRQDLRDVWKWITSNRLASILFIATILITAMLFLGIGYADGKRSTLEACAINAQTEKERDGALEDAKKFALQAVALTDLNKKLTAELSKLRGNLVQAEGSIEASANKLSDQKVQMANLEEKLEKAEKRANRACYSRRGTVSNSGRRSNGKAK